MFLSFWRKFRDQGTPSSFVKSALEVFWETTSGLEGRDELEKALSSLSDLDAITGDMMRDAFCALCERFFEKPPLSVNEPGEGHLASLSSVQSARGLSFDAVVLSGLGEGLFPPAGTEDPLMPDLVRERLNDVVKETFPDGGVALPLKKSREGEARFQLWTILQSAKEAPHPLRDERGGWRDG